MHWAYGTGWGAARGLLAIDGAHQLVYAAVAGAAYEGLSRHR